MSIETLIVSYGLPAIYIGCFAEGETAAILSGIVGHRAGFVWPLIAVVAGAGAFTSDQFWFLLARHAPDRGPIRRIRQKAAENKLLRRLEPRAYLLTLTFRYIPGTRILAPLVLAQTSLPWLVYLGLDALSVVIWASLFTALGYHFGAAAEHFLGRLTGHWIAVTLVLLGAFAAHLYLKHRKR